MEAYTMNFDFATVPAITAVVFGLGQLYKLTPFNTKWIPLFCGIAGFVLGILYYLVSMDAFEPIAFFSSVASGIASGLAATGAHQAVTQIASDKNHMDSYDGID